MLEIAVHRQTEVHINAAPSAALEIAVLLGTTVKAKAEAELYALLRAKNCSAASASSPAQSAHLRARDCSAARAWKRSGNQGTGPLAQAKHCSAVMRDVASPDTKQVAGSIANLYRSLKAMVQCWYCSTSCLLIGK